MVVGAKLSTKTIYAPSITTSSRSSANTISPISQSNYSTTKLTGEIYKSHFRRTDKRLLKQRKSESVKARSIHITQH